MTHVESRKITEIAMWTTTRHASINNSIPSNTHGHKWNYGNQNSRQLHVTQSNLSHASHG